MRLSFGWGKDEVLIIFGFVGFGALFAIFPRQLADRYGRKPLVLIFAVISTIAVVISNFFPETLGFILFRIISGLFGINLATVIISEEVPARFRGKSIGVIMGIAMTSSLLAAFLLTYLGPVDMWRYIYSTVALIGLVIISILWFKLKETKRFLFLKAKKRHSHSLFKVFSRKYLKILILSGIILFLTTWIYFTIKVYFLEFFATEKPNLSLTVLSFSNLGYLLMPIYVGSIIGYYSAGYLSDKIGRKKSIYITVATYFIGTILFLNTGDMLSDVPLIFISFFMINISFAVFRLVAEILAVEFFHTDTRAAGSGWVFTFAAVAGVAGNFIMHFLYNVLGGWGIMFLVVGTSCLIALVIITLFIPETKQRVVEEIYETEIEKLGA